MTKPRYIRCKGVWVGSHGTTKIGEYFDTDIQNNFSRYTWHEIYSERASNPKFYFDEVTEEEYNKATGKGESYEIF